MSNWGYRKANGPDTWANVAPAAGGKCQSPIDIIPNQAKFDTALKDKPFQLKYVAGNALKLINTGHSAQVTYNSDGSSLEGGPLTNQHKLAQFHLHWGKQNGAGSEHRINGKMYEAELHLVHYNTDVYSSFADAASQKDGLCVLGIFLQAGSKEHQGMKPFIDRLKEIKFKDQSVDMGAFDPAGMLPTNIKEYWTYPGSLTTPPCFESVTWVVFKEPIEVSESQMKAFRDMYCFCNADNNSSDEFGGHIVENYRPPCSLNGRQVRASFQ